MIKIPINDVKKILAEDFHNWFYRTRLYRPYRNVRDFLLWIVKVIQYAKFLWSDRDFDHGFVLRLLAFKLERTRNQIVKNNFITDVPQVDKEITRAIELIEKIRSGNYLEKEWDKHFEKFQIFRATNADGTFLHKPSPAESRSLTKLINREYKLKEADKEELFCDLLRNKLFGWWD